MVTGLPIEREAFIEFLLQAKRATYAAQGSVGVEVTPVLAGSHQLEYGQGELLYRDVYYGSVFFVGEEVVMFGGVPLWAMNYGGGVTVDNVDPAEVGEFLQSAMRLVAPDRPFRGPTRFQHGRYVYTDSSTGDLARFTGRELILLDERTIYELHYHGGLLRNS